MTRLLPFVVFDEEHDMSIIYIWADIDNTLYTTYKTYVTQCGATLLQIGCYNRESD